MGRRRTKRLQNGARHGQVLEGDAHRLEQGHVVPVAGGDKTACQLEQVGGHQLRAEPALLDGDDEVACLGQGARSGFHYHDAPKHRRRVQLPAVREVGADGDDVSARPEQRAVEEGHGAGSAAADDVRPGDLAGTGARGPDPQALRQRQ